MLRPLVELADQRTSEIVRVEVAQVVQPFAHADLEHGQPQLMGHGQRDAALGGAVELRDDDAVQIERAVELCLLYTSDVYRPAAADQLETLGGEIGVRVYRGDGQDPVKICLLYTSRCV